jgi:sugar lactone lactonase YvrE
VLSPSAIAVDTSGNLFIVNVYLNRIRKVSATTGIITTVAGNGKFGFSGDGGPATSASLNYPQGIALDVAGNIFISDTNNLRIREVSASTGIITTVAGNGKVNITDVSCCSSGDGGPATSAQLDLPSGIAVDTSRNLFIADTPNNRIRKVSPSGIITTVAGNGPSCAYSGSCVGAYQGDGGPATSATLFLPSGVAVDASGNLFIADVYDNRIRKVSSGIITAVAGSGPIENPSL